MPVSGVGSSGANVNPLTETSPSSFNATVASQAQSLSNAQASADAAMNSAAASGNQGAMLQAQAQEGELNAEETALSEEIKNKTDLMKTIAQNMGS